MRNAEHGLLSYLARIRETRGTGSSEAMCVIQGLVISPGVEAQNFGRHKLAITH